MSTADDWCVARGADLLLRLRVQPRSRVEGGAGLHAGRLRLRINAPPVDGRANARVIEWLAARLGIPATRIELLRGPAGRDKDVLLKDAAARIATVRAALES